MIQRAKTKVGKDKYDEETKTEKVKSQRKLCDVCKARYALAEKFQKLRTMKAESLRGLEKL